MSRFTPGDLIAVRGHRLGKIRTAKAAVVVEDTPEALSYWWPAGTSHVVTLGMTNPRDEMLPFTLAELNSGTWDLTTMPWYETDVLATTAPGSWAVVWHLWDHATGDFLYWYVDLKRPHQRTAVGFDTYDLDLDLVVQMDRTWSWKDRDEFDIRHGAGLITDEEVDAVQAAGAAMVESIERADPPFDGSRIGWRPDPTWTSLRLPDAWSTVPLA